MGSMTKRIKSSVLQLNVRSYLPTGPHQQEDGGE